ncbi:BMP family protein [Salinibacterium sp. NK8237]|uniref:BMP family lipoprotein n=1 Tax=Salinibacterium sp. NK8237 TaxID=2792038 RepID=UPI0018CC88EC|nr:BMP family ABC transporter substrate-binding protein [Salinibacterium sp. NK8237]MBH0131039.1 BMP family ABC transporter substrate-binding protein [Salinibacterium sp. NK8237]
MFRQFLSNSILEDTLRISTHGRALSGMALIATSALVLAGCASAPEETEAGSGEALDFLPCMVSDSGGFDDKSFNQLGYEGIEKAADELGVEFNAVESTSDADYAPNIESLVAEGCDLIVTVGFNLSAATVEFALANPDINFAIVDDAADNDFDGTVDAPNIKPILFDTAGAAFLAGYAAASYSTTGVVGTYGGMNFPTVSIFMDGAAQGVEYYNSEKGTDVTVRGWDIDDQDGTFIGSFAPGTDSRAAAQNLIDQGADVLLPVGGPIFQSAVEAIRDSGDDIALIGVDADLTETETAAADLFLTSILKQIGVAVEEVVTEASTGTLDTTAYIGTLENGGVGIAPFHEFESKVDAGLEAELVTVKDGIISGDIAVTSYLN